MRGCKFTSIVRNLFLCGCVFGPCCWLLYCYSDGHRTVGTVPVSRAHSSSDTRPVITNQTHTSKQREAFKNNDFQAVVSGIGIMQKTAVFSFSPKTVLLLTVVHWNIYSDLSINSNISWHILCLDLIYCLLNNVSNSYVMLYQLWFYFNKQYVWFRI